LSSGRIEIEATVLQATPLLGSPDAVVSQLRAGLGPNGQLQVIDSSSELLSIAEHVDLQELPDVNNVDAKEIFSAVRYLSGVFVLHVSHVASRSGIRIGFPDDVCKLGLLGNSLGGRVEVVAAGPLLEFWDAQEWVQYLKELSSHRKTLLEALKPWGTA
jgi:DNA-binding transcriptional regulator/RsmH inhibitor MraZ